MQASLRRGPSEWGLLIGLVLVWGTGFAVISVAVHALPPATVVATRLTIAALVLLLVQRVRAVPLPRGRHAWAWLALLGVVGNVLPFSLISWGMMVVPSGTAGILMAVMPLCTLLLAHFFVPGERLTPARVAGFVLGFAGVVVLLGPEALRALGGGANATVRQLAVLLGAVCYAVNAILTRRAPPLPALVLSSCTLAFAALVMLPAAIVIDRPWTLAPPPLALLAAAWLGLVSTALATLAYFRLVVAAGPTFFSLINFLIPPTAVLTGLLLLGERLPTSTYAALALVLTGLVFGQRR